MGRSADSTLPLGQNLNNLSEDEYSEEGPGGSPGDGICPSASQFDEIYNTTRTIWAGPAHSTSPRHDSSDVFCVNGFFDLLTDIPAFGTQPLARASLETGNGPCIRYALQWQTTTHPECDHPHKVTYCYQRFAFAKPQTYETLNESGGACRSYPGLSADRVRYWSSLVLAWSYVLSCRWVEILQKAGLQASLQHLNSDRRENDFWDMVNECRWQATLVHSGTVYYAPWMLRSAQDHKAEVPSHRVVRPDSAAAFDNLARSCASRGLANECATALATVMLLTSNLEVPLWLSRPMMHSNPVVTHLKGDRCYDKLFDAIEKCMTVSCCWDGLDSLICSVFFDPSVPCNLVGAHHLAIRHAVMPLQGNFDHLAIKIARRHPRMALLWLATIWGGRAARMLSITLDDLPPIDFLVASWTGTIQSFLQVSYRPIIDGREYVTRACEFTTSYLSRPEVNNPRVPPPPFGSTRMLNTSLEVRPHLAHNHKPLCARLLLALDSGETLPAFESSWSLPWSEVSLQQPQDVQGFEAKIPENERYDADGASCLATQYLFGWHGDCDDGLWLAEGAHDPVDMVRKFQSHPWLKPAWHDEDEEFEDNNADEDTTRRSLDRSRISTWQDEVAASQRYRHPRRAYETL